ncbi:hypothetical protein I548_3687 [Mycobacterium intracellulare]|nr:hypothetical protein I548_3687 [Mycobacterium intracellulare]
MKDESVPWATGLTVAAFVAAVTAAAIVVLTLGLVRVHLLLAVGLNIVAAGDWRRPCGGGGAPRSCAGSCSAPESA